MFRRSWVWLTPGTQIFSLSHAPDMLVIRSFHISFSNLNSLSLHFYQLANKWAKMQTFVHVNDSNFAVSSFSMPVLNYWTTTTKALDYEGWRGHFSARFSLRIEWLFLVKLNVVVWLVMACGSATRFWHFSWLLWYIPTLWSRTVYSYDLWACIWAETLHKLRIVSHPFQPLHERIEVI